MCSEGMQSRFYSPLFHSSYLPGFYCLCSLCSLPNSRGTWQYRNFSCLSYFPSHPLSVAPAVLHSLSAVIRPLSEFKSSWNISNSSRCILASVFTASLSFHAVYFYTISNMTQSLITTVILKHLFLLSVSHVWTLSALWLSPTHLWAQGSETRAHTYTHTYMLIGLLDPLAL